MCICMFWTSLTPCVLPSIHPTTSQISYPYIHPSICKTNVSTIYDSAIELDDCNVRGYTAWSFLDNLEWSSGYSQHFGMFNVDFSNPDRPRTPKQSATFYSSVVEANGFPQEAP